MRLLWILSIILATATLRVSGNCRMQDDMVRVAVCRVASDTGSAAEPVSGSITFYQMSNSMVAVGVSLSGFVTSNDHTLHGFHIHQNGDLGDGCRDAGGHFNPFNRDHGAPADTVRHVGDLGNIVEDSTGSVNMTICDNSGLIEFDGDNSIIGRAMVIHETMDDLGRGGAASSLTTGNAGGRLACCVIEESVPEPLSAGTVTAAHVSSVLLVATAAFVTLFTRH